MPDALFYLLFFVAIAFSGIAEMRYKNTSGIVIVFAAAWLSAVVSASWLSVAVALSIAWSVARWPDAVLLPALFQPNAWPIILTGTGVRHGLVELGSLLIIGCLSLVYPWQALVASIVSLDLWRAWWNKTGRGSRVPAVPGILAGLGLFLAVHLIGVV